MARALRVDDRLHGARTRRRFESQEEAAAENVALGMLYPPPRTARPDRLAPAINPRTSENPIDREISSLIRNLLYPCVGRYECTIRPA